MTVIVKVCPGCLHEKRMTRHHVYPRRHFGNHKKNPTVFLLCVDCHRRLEGYIPDQLMKREFYLAVIRIFLQIQKEKRDERRPGTE